LQYIKEYRKARYTSLLLSGKLNSYLADIDQQAEAYKRAHRAGKEEPMNIRKPVDYGALFAALDTLMAASLP